VLLVQSQCHANDSNRSGWVFISDPESWKIPPAYFGVPVLDRSVYVPGGGG